MLSRFVCVPFAREEACLLLSAGRYRTSFFGIAGSEFLPFMLGVFFCSERLELASSQLEDSWVRCWTFFDGFCAREVEGFLF